MIDDHQRLPDSTLLLQTVKYQHDRFVIYTAETIGCKKQTDPGSDSRSRQGSDFTDQVIRCHVFAVLREIFIFLDPVSQTQQWVRTWLRTLTALLTEKKIIIIISIITIKMADKSLNIQQKKQIPKMLHLLWFIKHFSVQQLNVSQLYYAIRYGYMFYKMSPNVNKCIYI